MKSTSQNGLYWGEFKDALAARQRRGPVDREVWRKQLHVRAGAVDRLGRPKSSKDFTNRDIDRWKGVCRAYYKGGDLDAQLEIERQPVLRAIYACEPYLETLGIALEKREAYLAGIYRNLQRKRVREGRRELALHEMPESDLGLVVAALKHTTEHKTGKAHQHPRTPYASGKARHSHNVGARSTIYVAVDGAAHLELAPADDDGEPARHDPDPAYVPPPGEAF